VREGHPSKRHLCTEFEAGEPSKPLFFPENFNHQPPHIKFKVLSRVYRLTPFYAQANPLLAEIHNTKRRIPVILRPEDERRWLSDISLDEAMGLLAPYDEKAMEAHTVSKLITTRGIPTNVPDVMNPYRYGGAN
jgi:hypothetical protein